MRSSSAVVVMAGTNLPATDKSRMFPKICLPLCAWLAPLAFEIHEAVSELLHMRLYVEEKLREHGLPHVIGPGYELVMTRRQLARHQVASSETLRDRLSPLSRLQ